VRLLRVVHRSIKIRFLLWMSCVAGVLAAWLLPMTLLDGLENAIEFIRLETIDYDPSG
jgi:hypothetical protein